MFDRTGDQRISSADYTKYFKSLTTPDMNHSKKNISSLKQISLFDCYEIPINLDN